MKWDQFLSAIFLSVLLFLANPFDLAKAAGDLNVEVEIETGPTFESGDSSTIRGCFQTSLGHKFPIGIIGTIPESSKTVCPSITFFEDTHEFCWLVDIWHVIEPGVIIYWIIQIILHL